MTTSIDTTSELLHTVLTELAGTVERVTPDQLSGRTPCTDFDVAELRRHIIGWLTLFADGYADPEGKTAASIDDFQVSDDPAGQVRTAADRMKRALADDAAERPLYLGEAAMPGELALGMILWEYQVHGWDLARATGQPWQPPQAAAEESLRFAPAMLTPDYQGEGKPFGPAVAVADDASAIDRLVAISGRNPRWTP